MSRRSVGWDTCNCPGAETISLNNDDWKNLTLLELKDNNFFYCEICIQCALINNICNNLTVLCSQVPFYFALDSHPWSTLLLCLSDNDMGIKFQTYITGSINHTALYLHRISAWEHDSLSTTHKNRQQSPRLPVFWWYGGWLRHWRHPDPWGARPGWPTLWSLWSVKSETDC